MRKMMDSNIGLVVSIAQQYGSKKMDPRDLIIEGLIGLVRGIVKFDPTKGCRFSTYGHYWIRQAVGRASLKEADVVCVPTRLQQVFLKGQRKRRELQGYSGSDPSDSQIARHLGVTERMLKQAQRAMQPRLSLEAPSRRAVIGDLVEGSNAVEPEEVMIQQGLKEDLDNVLNTLTPRESGILRLRYGLDDGLKLTLTEVGVVFKVTRERIRQIEKEAIAKLREPSRSNVLAEYALTNSKSLPWKSASFRS